MKKVYQQKEALDIAYGLWTWPDGTGHIAYWMDKCPPVSTMSPEEARGYIHVSMEPTDENADEIVAMFATELMNICGPREEVLYDLMQAHNAMRLQLIQDRLLADLPSLAVYKDKKERRK